MNYKVKINFKRILGYLIFFVISFSAFSPQIVGATMYLPNETLEPDCAPASSNCGVISNISAYFNATSTTATSTFPYASTTAIQIGSNYITNIAGTGLTVNGGVLSATGGSGGANSKWATSTDTTSIFLNSATKVGIGTSSPYAMLSVAGEVVGQMFTATSSTATSTFAGGLSITGTGTGLNFGPGTLFYQNNQRFLTSSTTSAGNLTIGYQSATNIDANGGLGNTGLGYQTFRNATSTLITHNTALGYQALYGSTTISSFDDNTAVGYQSLFSNDGIENTAVGSLSLYSNNDGSDNTAIGKNSLYSNTTGNYNTAIGDVALVFNTTGWWNTAIGAYALSDNTSSYWNTAIGGSALTANTGNYNTAVGEEALTWNTTGSNNTAIGSLSLWDNFSATSTTAMGYYAAGGLGVYHNQGGVYVGYQSGRSAQSNSDYNTLVGYQSGYGITTGSNNIWLGSATSSTGIANLTIGSQNILIGNNISLPSATANGQLDIGNIIYGTGITSTGSVLSSGSIGIGTTSPWRTLSVTGSMAATNLTSGAAGDFALCINNTTKEITNAGATGCVVSSKRFKENIYALDSGIDELMQLKPSRFNYIGQTGEHIGLIAEDVDMVDKRLVEYEADGVTPRTVRYMEMSALLIKSIQDLNLKVNSLIQATTTGSSTISSEPSSGLFSWIVNNFKTVLGITFENERVKVKNLCVGETCVTEEQFKAVFGSSQSSANYSIGSSSSSNQSNSLSSSSSSSSINSISSSSSSSLLASSSSSTISGGGSSEIASSSSNSVESSSSSSASQSSQSSTDSATSSSSSGQSISSSSSDASQTSSSEPVSSSSSSENPPI